MSGLVEGARARVASDRPRVGGEPWPNPLAARGREPGQLQLSPTPGREHRASLGPTPLMAAGERAATGQGCHVLAWPFLVAR